MKKSSTSIQQHVSAKVYEGKRKISPNFARAKKFKDHFNNFHLNLDIIGPNTKQKTKILISLLIQIYVLLSNYRRRRQKLYKLRARTHQTMYQTKQATKVLNTCQLLIYSIKQKMTTAFQWMLMRSKKKFLIKSA